ncbi:phenylacetate--CoA ligase family protein [Nocardia callitridis]
MEAPVARPLSPAFVEATRAIPFYREQAVANSFPVITKADLAQSFPESFLTPQVEQALESGAAQYVWSTGTNHARMQLIRPPLFLLRTYYAVWQDHPDIGDTFAAGVPRISVTTRLATDHVARVNESKGGEPTDIARRWLDDRTFYINQDLDPALWTPAAVERMLAEIDTVRSEKGDGRYHLDCSSYHAAYLLRAGGTRLAQPVSAIHGYEFTPRNVRRFLEEHLDCPVVELFGSTELGYLYYGDTQGRYHPHLEHMEVELQPIPGTRGIHNLIVSSIRNPFMPLLRYNTGDCVHTSDGSADPRRIVRFCGREKELLVTDTAITSQAELDDVVANVSPRVFVYQLRVEGGDGRLAYTTFDETALDADETTALAASAAQLTGLSVTVEHRRHIPIGKSGKYAWLER